MHTASPTMKILHQNGAFVKIDEPILTHHHLPSPQFMTLSVVHFMSFDKCIMTCICPYSIIWNSFTVLNIPSALPIHLYIPPCTLETIDLFTVPIVLLHWHF